jgi:hypothetical protein
VYASYPGGGYVDLINRVFREKGLYISLAGQIQFLASGGNQLNAYTARELTTDSGANHARMAGNIDAHSGH